MAGKLIRVFKSKLAIAVLGAVLVAAAGTTVALAAAGAQRRDPRASQGQSLLTRSQAGADDNNHSSGARQNSQHIEGAISSIDASHSSIVVASEHSGNVTVVVGDGTVFDEGLSGFADLKVGMFVEVNGNSQSDNTLTATRIERGNDANDANDANNANSVNGVAGDDRPSDDNHRGNGSDGSGGPGRGGHDDGVPHS